MPRTVWLLVTQWYDSAGTLEPLEIEEGVSVHATKAGAQAELLEMLKLDYAHPDGGYGELDAVIDGSTELGDTGVAEEADLEWRIVEKPLAA